MPSSYMILLKFILRRLKRRKWVVFSRDILQLLGSGHNETRLQLENGRRVKKIHNSEKEI